MTYWLVSMKHKALRGVSTASGYRAFITIPQERVPDLNLDLSNIMSVEFRSDTMKSRLKSRFPTQPMLVNYELWFFVVVLWYLVGF